MSNAPNPEMDDFLSRYRREEEQRHRRAEEHARYACGALRFFGVEKVEAAFDGYGDDGSMEEAVFTPQPPGELPYGLDNMIQDICSRMLPGGWEINEGSYGKVVLEVQDGKIHVDLEWREEEEYDEEME